MSTTQKKLFIYDEHYARCLPVHVYTYLELDRHAARRYFFYAIISEVNY